MLLAFHRDTHPLFVAVAKLGVNTRYTQVLSLADMRHAKLSSGLLQVSPPAFRDKLHGFRDYGIQKGRKGSNLRQELQRLLRYQLRHSPTLH